MENGIINNKHVCVEVRAIIADAPAKAFLKQIKTILVIFPVIDVWLKVNITKNLFHLVI